MVEAVKDIPQVRNKEKAGYDYKGVSVWNPAYKITISPEAIRKYEEMVASENSYPAAEPFYYNTAITV